MSYPFDQYYLLVTAQTPADWWQVFGCWMAGMEVHEAVESLREA